MNKKNRGKNSSNKLFEKEITIRITQSRIVISVFLFFFAILFFSYGSLNLYVNQKKVSHAKIILSENKLLRNKLAQLNTQLETISKKIEEMENWEDQIRSEQNFKKIKKEIREMGVGGYPKIDSTFSIYNPQLNLEYNLLNNKLFSLKNKIYFDEKTHSELVDNFKLKESLFRNTPSIYPTFGRISDKYGWRIHPISKKRKFHYGIDFANHKGTPVYATADGIVENTGRIPSFGRFIKLKHKFGYQTKYAHLAKIFVKSGQRVTRGQIIGLVGNSGRSTGPHLHYEVLRYGKHRNPYKYLNKSKSDIILAKK